MLKECGSLAYHLYINNDIFASARTINCYQKHTENHLVNSRVVHVFLKIGTIMSLLLTGAVIVNSHTEVVVRL